VIFLTIVNAVYCIIAALFVSNSTCVTDDNQLLCYKRDKTITVLEVLQETRIRFQPISFSSSATASKVKVKFADLAGRC